MYAIVKTGGKQYMAEKDAVLIVDKLEGEAGTALELGEVVLVVDGRSEERRVGKGVSPYV